MEEQRKEKGNEQERREGRRGRGGSGIEVGGRSRRKGRDKGLAETREGREEWRRRGRNERERREQKGREDVKMVLNSWFLPQQHTCSSARVERVIIFTYHDATEVAGLEL